MKRIQRFSWGYCLWSGVMIVLPLLLVAYYSITRPHSTGVTYTLEHFGRFWQNPVFMKVFYLSFKLAFITTVLSLFFGYPVAYILAQKPTRYQEILIFIITFPIWINMLVRTYAWIGILQDNGLLTSLLGIIGIKINGLMYTETAVLIGMVYNFIPFMIVQIYHSIEKIDRSLLEAAQDLGANQYTVFRKVILPLSIPGIVSGITLVFLPAISTFIIPKFLGGSQYVLVGNLIENEFFTSGAWNFGSALSMILALIMFILMFILRKVDRGENHAVL